MTKGREGVQNRNSDQLSDIVESDSAAHETNPVDEEEDDESSSSIYEDIYSSTGEDGDSIMEDSSHEQNTNEEAATGMTSAPSHQGMYGYDLSGRNFAPQEEEEKTEVEDYRNEGDTSTPSYLDNGRVAPVNQSSSQVTQTDGEIIHSEKGSSLLKVEEGDQCSATSSADVAAGDKNKDKPEEKVCLGLIIGSVLLVVAIAIGTWYIRIIDLRDYDVECDPTLYGQRADRLGDGFCHADLNTKACEWDRGDCINEVHFPLCAFPTSQFSQISIGDGYCESDEWCDPDYDEEGDECWSEVGMLGTKECRYEGGDCQEVDCNDETILTDFCIDFRNKYNTSCQVANSYLIGNGVCNFIGEYNTIQCGYDGGDCEPYQNCTIEAHVDVDTYTYNLDYLYAFKDGICHSWFNTKECGFDGGDCLEFNELYPDCNTTYPDRSGDGLCDNTEEDNVEECGFDGGDCDEFNANYPHCPFGVFANELGNGLCSNYDEFNNAECGYDGGDCVEFNTKYPECNVGEAHLIGDGVCHNLGFYYGEFNNAECGYDGGDCVEFNTKYPECLVAETHLIGDGVCHNYGFYNTIECGYDGGDCIEFNEEYPDCNVKYPSNLGNGNCYNYDEYNSEECGYDGGDCIEFNEKYPDCDVDLLHIIGDGECYNYGKYNTIECGYDGGDCIGFNEQYPNCKIIHPDDYLGDGYCNANWNTEECGYDGGDCI